MQPQAPQGSGQPQQVFQFGQGQGGAPNQWSGSGRWRLGMPLAQMAPPNPAATAKPGQPGLADTAGIQRAMAKMANIWKFAESLSSAGQAHANATSASSSSPSSAGFGTMPAASAPQQTAPNPGQQPGMMFGQQPGMMPGQPGQSNNVKPGLYGNLKPMLFPGGKIAGYLWKLGMMTPGPGGMQPQAGTVPQPPPPGPPGMQMPQPATPPGQPLPPPPPGGMPTPPGQQPGQPPAPGMQPPGQPQAQPGGQPGGAQPPAPPLGEPPPPPLPVNPRMGPQAPATSAQAFHQGQTLSLLEGNQSPDTSGPMGDLTAGGMAAGIKTGAYVRAFRVLCGEKTAAPWGAIGQGALGAGKALLGGAGKALAATPKYIGQGLRTAGRGLAQAGGWAQNMAGRGADFLNHQGAKAVSWGAKQLGAAGVSANPWAQTQQLGQQLGKGVNYARQQLASPKGLMGSAGKTLWGGFGGAQVGSALSHTGMASPYALAGGVVGAGMANPMVQRLASGAGKVIPKLYSTLGNKMVGAGLGGGAGALFDTGANMLGYDTNHMGALGGAALGGVAGAAGSMRPLGGLGRYLKGAAGYHGNIGTLAGLGAAGVGTGLAAYHYNQGTGAYKPNDMFMDQYGPAPPLPAGATAAHPANYIAGFQWPSWYPSQLKWGEDKAAAQDSTKPQLSATGESEGLSYRHRPDDYAKGHDAWKSLSKYFKGGAKIEKEPDPFQGEHHGKEKAAGVLQTVGNGLLGGFKTLGRGAKLMQARRAFGMAKGLGTDAERVIGKAPGLAGGGINHDASALGSAAASLRESPAAKGLFDKDLGLGAVRGGLDPGVAATTGRHEAAHGLVNAYQTGAAKTAPWLARQAADMQKSPHAFVRGLGGIADETFAHAAEGRTPLGQVYRGGRFLVNPGAAAANYPEIAAKSPTAARAWLGATGLAAAGTAGGVGGAGVIAGQHAGVIPHGKTGEDSFVDGFFSACAGMAEDQLRATVEKAAEFAPEAADELRAELEKRAVPVGQMLGTAGKFLGRQAPRLMQGIKRTAMSGPAMRTLGGGLTGGIVGGGMGLPGTNQDYIPFNFGTAALGAAAMNPALRSFARKSVVGNAGMNAMRMGGLGGLGGEGVDLAAGALGYDTDHAGARLGFGLGAGAGAMRGGASTWLRNLAPGTPRTQQLSKVLTPLANIGKGADKGMYQFYHGGQNAMTGVGHKIQNALTGLPMSTPHNWWMTPGVGGRAATMGGRLALGTLGAGALSYGYGRARDQVRGEANQYLGEAYQGLKEQGGHDLDEHFDQYLGSRLPDVSQYARQQGDEYFRDKMQGLGMTDQQGSVHPTYGLFRAMGMDPEQMTPMQRMSMLGGGATGLAGLATGNPYLMGGGALAGLGGLFAGRGQMGGFGGGQSEPEEPTSQWAQAHYRGNGM